MTKAMLVGTLRKANRVSEASGIAAEIRAALDALRGSERLAAEHADAVQLALAEVHALRVTAALERGPVEAAGPLLDYETTLAPDPNEVGPPFLEHLAGLAEFARASDSLGLATSALKRLDALLRAADEGEAREAFRLLRADYFMQSAACALARKDAHAAHDFLVKHGSVLRPFLTSSVAAQARHFRALHLESTVLSRLLRTRLASDQRSWIQERRRDALFEAIQLGETLSAQFGESSAHYPLLLECQMRFIRWVVPDSDPERVAGAIEGAKRTLVLTRAGGEPDALDHYHAAQLNLLIGKHLERRPEAEVYLERCRHHLVESRGREGPNTDAIASEVAAWLMRAFLRERKYVQAIDFFESFVSEREASMERRSSEILVEFANARTAYAEALDRLGKEGKALSQAKLAAEGALRAYAGRRRGKTAHSQAVRISVGTYARLAVASGEIEAALSTLHAGLVAYFDAVRHARPEDRVSRASSHRVFAIVATHSGSFSKPEAEAAERNLRSLETWAAKAEVGDRVRRVLLARVEKARRLLSNSSG